MTRWALVAPLLLLLLSVAVGQTPEEPAAAPGRAPDGAPADTEDDADEWGLNSLRGGLESVGGYFDSVLELMGGRDGVCQHRCRYGRAPLAGQLPSLNPPGPSRVTFSGEKKGRVSFITPRKRTRAPPESLDFSSYLCRAGNSLTESTVRF